MTLPIIALLLGLILLVWSADRFVDGAAATAKYLGMPSLLIGMLIVGFGTSAPEMVVSALAAAQGSPEIALGNAYGSNITNIALILGVTALVCPILVGSSILHKELPVLMAVVALSAFQIWDNSISRLDAILLLTIFVSLISWAIYRGMRKKDLPSEAAGDQNASMSLSRAIMWLVIGLAVLVGSSQLLVWGAVQIATALGVDEIIIGLTVIAIGTSLPELAASIAAVRKGEHDIALGNVIGSNMFNALGVIGIAGCIQPMTVGPEVFARDMMTMATLTFVLFLIAFNFKKNRRRINRLEGGILVLIYLAYNGYLIATNIP